MHKDVEIGRMPIMLRSNKCILYDADESKMAKLNECPLDPGGYFIVNGTEKVILVQEQLAPRIVSFVEAYEKKALFRACASSSMKRKSKTYVLPKMARSI
ncbi:ATV_HP_G0140850.mRNA.1.CDS.1 [Saccharomyces cerevisiae]|nr:ATV_HP_G0140850.mRNA.1.CDS.1 [Saccharomyces cerevisiae]CAI6905672.1 ATV_HP_G0140850.mRNA.1.CDS.1 [Saccharomyces cerevisiae]